MSWARVRHYIDMQIGHHVAHYEDSVTGAKHILQTWLSHDSCPTCGHVLPKTNTDEIDFPALETELLAGLEASHANMHRYAKKHGIPVRRKDGKAR